MTLSKQARIILTASLLSLAIPAFSLEKPLDMPLGKVVAETSIDAALLQEGNGEFDKAIDLYENLIEKLQLDDGTFSYLLIDPLLGLARSYFETHAFEATIQVLARSQHLIHRYQGVYSPYQNEGIDLLIKTHLEMDNPDLANKQQTFRLFISEHNVGKESIELLPVLEQINRWYIETGQFNRARKSLQRSQEIIVSEGGEFDSKQLDILSSLSKVKRLSRLCCSYKILEDGLSILNANPNLSKSIQASYYLALGDAYTLGRKYEAAQHNYAKAWNLAEANLRAGLDEPRGIEFAKEIDGGRSPHKKIYLVDHDRIGSRRFEEVSRQEKLILETLTPQYFQFSTTPDAPRYRIRDLNAGTASYGKKEVEMIGYPFIFNREQLKQALPARYQKDESLKTLKIEMEFTVSSTGRTEEVKILTPNLPTKLSRLMRDVLNRSHFRPRIANGVPISSNSVRLIQTFE